MNDWYFALRMIARRRTFAAVAIGTLALGIGAATAIYSVVDTVLLRPLPFDAPDRIAAVWITQPSIASDPVLSWLANATPMGRRSTTRFVRTRRRCATSPCGRRGRSRSRRTTGPSVSRAYG